MKKKMIYGAVIAIFIFIALIVSRFTLGGGEDDWIKDSKGVWIKHGNPSVTPSYVNAQKQAMICAFTLYNFDKKEGNVFDSQCLGICGNYAVDVVHNPRTEADDLLQNQCSDYTSGRINNFIELDKDMNIVRITDSNN